MFGVVRAGSMLSLEAAALYRQGLELAEKGKHELAIKKFAASVILAPKFVSAYYEMGNCYEKIGWHQEAVQTFDKVLRLDPYHGDAKMRKEWNLAKIGDPDFHL